MKNRKKQMNGCYGDSFSKNDCRHEIATGATVRAVARTSIAKKKIQFLALICLALFLGGVLLACGKTVSENMEEKLREKGYAVELFYNENSEHQVTFSGDYFESEKFKGASVKLEAHKSSVESSEIIFLEIYFYDNDRFAKDAEEFVKKSETGKLLKRKGSILYIGCTQSFKDLKIAE